MQAPHLFVARSSKIYGRAALNLWYISTQYDDLGKIHKVTIPLYNLDSSRRPGIIRTQRKQLLACKNKTEDNLNQSSFTICTKLGILFFKESMVYINLFFFLYKYKGYFGSITNICTENKQKKKTRNQITDGNEVE